MWRRFCFRLLWPRHGRAASDVGQRRVIAERYAADLHPDSGAALLLCQPASRGRLSGC